MPETCAMIPAFVLGVPNKYRGQFLQQDLAQQQIPCTVVEGLDGSLLSPAELASVYSSRAAQIVNHRQLTRAEIACAIGHQRLMEALVASGQPWALLLEDDVRLPHPLSPILSSLSLLPGGPTVVQLRTPRPRATVMDRIPYSEGAFLLQSEYSRRTDAYLVNGAAARIAQAAYRNRPVDSPADFPFRWARRVQFWALDHEVVVHDQGESLIRSGRRSQHRPPPRHPVVDAGIGLGQLLGVAALYGALHGLPIRDLYHRDVHEGPRRIQRLRRASVPDQGANPA